MKPRGPGFFAATTRALRRAGLSGDRAAVAFVEGAVVIAGEQGGSLVLPFDALERVRAGMVSSKSRVFYELRLFRAGEPRALCLHPLADVAEEAGYAAFVRALAARLDGRCAVLETGATKLWAAFMVALGALVSAAFAALVAFVLLEDERALGIPRAFALVLPAAFCAGSVAFVVWSWSRHWPRRARSVEDLAKVLPPPAQ